MAEMTETDTAAPVPTRADRSLIAAVVAGIGASICCVGPLVLLTLGIGGAWIGTLTALEPYRPLFIGVVLVFLGLAFYKLYIAPRRCAPGDACALPATLRNQRILFWVVTVLIAALVAFPWYGVALLG